MTPRRRGQPSDRDVATDAAYLLAIGVGAAVAVGTAALKALQLVEWWARRRPL